jgi:hypothetical protein
MSLTSLAVSFANAYGPPRSDSGGLQKLGVSGGSDDKGALAARADITSLTDYVPTEILTLYIAGVAAIQNYKFPETDHVTGRLLLAAIFWLCIVVCIIWVIAGVFLTSKKWPPARSYIWPACAAVIAFAVYAVAIPDSWIALRITYGTLFASIGVLIVTPLLYLLTKLYAKVFPPPLAA